MTSVRFFGPIGDYSGYGNAVKNFALSFSRSKIPTKFMFGAKAKKDHADILDKLDSYLGNCKIDFYLHGPPYSRHKSKASYKIAYFYWEADTLPIAWNRSISHVNELWVPCNLVKEACLKAKFKGPIRVVPTPCAPLETDKKIIIPSSFAGDFVVSDEVYKFYSIFQWHERKGYKELLNSYYRTFTEKDKVLLILKVNALNISGNTEDLIKPDILAIKRKLNLSYYPPVYLMTNLVSNETIQAIHNTADCYVAPHHGEGWGLPIHDAMISGNQIIATKFGGVTEYLDEQSAHIIPHKTGPVSGMQWMSLYGPYQNWAYPSTNHLSRIMRDVYENSGQYRYKGDNAKKIGHQMDIDGVARIIEKNLAGM